MRLQNIVDVIALNCCIKGQFTQSQIAQQMTNLQLSAHSASAYKRSVTRLHQLGLIKLVQSNKTRQGNTKYYEITQAGKDELNHVRTVFFL
jgi:DNA-binding PadR family transcriptional regulator